MNPAEASRATAGQVVPVPRDGDGGPVFEAPWQANTFAMTADQSSTVLLIVMRRPMSFASMPLNQQRSQLSLAYCTTSRKGGEVTVSCTLRSRRLRVEAAEPSRNRA